MSIRLYVNNTLYFVTEKVEVPDTFAVKVVNGEVIQNAKVDQNIRGKDRLRVHPTIKVPSTILQRQTETAPKGQGHLHPVHHSIQEVSRYIYVNGWVV